MTARAYYRTAAVNGRKIFWAGHDRARAAGRPLPTGEAS